MARALTPSISASLQILVVYFPPLTPGRRYYSEENIVAIMEGDSDARANPEQNHVGGRVVEHKRR